MSTPPSGACQSRVIFTNVGPSLRSGRHIAKKPAMTIPYRPGEDEVVRGRAERALVAADVDVQRDVPVHAEQRADERADRKAAGHRGPARLAGDALGEAVEPADDRHDARRGGRGRPSCSTIVAKPAAATCVAEVCFGEAPGRGRLGRLGGREEGQTGVQGAHVRHPSTMSSIHVTFFDVHVWPSGRVDRLVVHDVSGERPPRRRARWAAAQPGPSDRSADAGSRRAALAGSSWTRKARTAGLTAAHAFTSVAWREPQHVSVNRRWEIRWRFTPDRKRRTSRALFAWSLRTKVTRSGLSHRRI